MKLKKAKTAAVAVAALGLVLGMMTVGTSQAEITIDTVTVGNAGNANDTTGYGGVAYTYNTGKCEVNLTQYTAVLNAVAVTDTYSLYNTNMGTALNIAGIFRSGSSGSYSDAVIGSGNRNSRIVLKTQKTRSYSYSLIGSGNCPVTFANWMANGQATGTQNAAITENAAYTLSGATSGVFTKNAISPNTSEAPTYWIPSENEWYKAAYYQPSANGGAFSNSASFYGTYDQGGNVSEWNDAVISGSSRGFRWGSWRAFLDSNLRPSYRLTYGPTIEN